MAILNVPPDVYYHDQMKKRYGVSQYELDNQIGKGNPMNVIADAIKEVAKTNPNINVTVHVHTNDYNGKTDPKSPMIKIEEK